MVRSRVLALAVTAMMVVGVSAAIACDEAKTQQASAEKSCSTKASVEKASAQKASSCSQKATAETASASGCSKKATAETASASGCSKKATAETASASGCADKASTEMASAGHCSKASTEMASAGCSKADMAKCQYLCETGKASFAKMAPFAFMNEAKDVAVGVEPTEAGFAFVFAGENEATIDKAVALANKSMSMMQAPAACSATRSAMTQKAGGCETTEACLTALANCKISVVKTETGARTEIAGTDEAKVAALHGFLASTGFGPATEKTAGE